MNRCLMMSAVTMATLSLLGACGKSAANGGKTTSDASSQTPNAGAAAGAASTVDKAQDAVGGAVGMASAAMPTTAQGFVTAAANSDMYEMKAAEVALTRSKSPKIKAFAKKMVHDHGMTTAEVKSILAKGGASGVSPPADLDARRTGLLDNLKSATADGFDKTYLDQQVAAHTEAETLMKGYGEHGDNAGLKAFAAKTAPTVQAHLDMAKAMDSAAQATPAKTPG